MKRTSFLFCVGSTLYPLLELLWRGRSHISMALAGGVCLCLMDRICLCRKWCSRWIPCVIGSAIITCVEFCFGVYVNLIGKRNVWDYAHLPGNVLGQICLPFSIGWFFLSIPALSFCRLCRRSRFFQK